MLIWRYRMHTVCTPVVTTPHPIPPPRPCLISCLAARGAQPYCRHLSPHLTLQQSSTGFPSPLLPPFPLLFLPSLHFSRLLAVVCVATTKVPVQPVNPTPCTLRTDVCRTWHNVCRIWQQAAASTGAWWAGPRCRPRRSYTRGPVAAASTGETGSKVGDRGRGEEGREEREGGGFEASSWPSAGGRVRGRAHVRWAGLLRCVSKHCMLELASRARCGFQRALPRALGQAPRARPCVVGRVLPWRPCAVGGACRARVQRHATAPLGPCRWG